MHIKISTKYEKALKPKYTLMFNIVKDLKTLY